MVTIISCAKTMRNSDKGIQSVLEECAKGFATPHFQSEAESIAAALAKFPPEKVATELKVNPKIALSTHNNYQNFGRGESGMMPALFSYNGIVFKTIDGQTLTLQQLNYCNAHLLITSFLYGLLAPFDLIEPYRLEGKVRPFGEQSLFGFWQGRTTDYLISRVEQSGGVLCNLASGEMQELFEWKKVCDRVKVVTPTFFEVVGEKRKNIVVYTKIARGLMSRYIVEHGIETIEQLKEFNLQGYSFVEERGGELIFERISKK